MARCLLAWELGTHYGHLVALRGLARELRRAGHECVFAVRELGAAQDFLGAELGPLLQAPMRLRLRGPAVRSQVSYAALLHNTGFNDPGELAGRIGAWRTLYRELRIEQVFADHSPVALVAARTLGIPAAALGSGFTLPPRQAPFPAFRTRPAVPQSVLLRNDAAVLRELNAALARLGLRPFALLQDIFRGVRTAVLSYKALDPYEERGEPHRGLPDYAWGERPRWPAGTGPRVFAYVRASPVLGAVLRALRKRRARLLVRCADEGARALVRRHAGRDATLADGAVDFRAAAEGADALVNYGAHATVAEFLLAGKPAILLPDLQERALTARRAQALGAALIVRDGGAAGAALDEVLEDPAPRRAAEAFAARHARQDRRAILPGFVAESL
jgi:UDP:flavonoid glycosyltransferase YjiC (YdhE family)